MRLYSLIPHTLNPKPYVYMHSYSYIYICNGLYTKSIFPYSSLTTSKFGEVSKMGPVSLERRVVCHVIRLRMTCLHRYYHV